MILLDTVALVRLVTAQKFRQTAKARIAEAEAQGQLFVSAITAWELCLLQSLSRTGELIDEDGATFFRSTTANGALQVISVDADIAIESRQLPGDFHKDPADRFIVATARLHDLTLVTSDRAVLDYATSGHVTAIRC